MGLLMEMLDMIMMTIDTTNKETPIETMPRHINSNIVGCNSERRSRSRDGRGQSLQFVRLQAGFGAKPAAGRAAR